MKEIPILFSAPMVRAILDGRKTQTRRVVKLVGADTLEEREDGSLWPYSSTWADGDERGPWLACPYGEPGDRLWVRETWQAWKQVSIESDEWDPITREVRSGEDWALWVELRGKPDKIEYRATSESVGPWTPSIHMPRWASRITLEVVSVRVERLQEISNEDAKAEGVRAFEHDGAGVYEDYELGDGTWCNDARGSFATLWRSINGPESWAANPWVWRVEFKRLALTEGTKS